MAHFYNLPCNVNGLATSSDQLDAQYGHEATAGAMLAYLCGADEIFSIGLLGNAQILSLEKMVLDNYLARQIEYMLAPVSMDETHLSVKLIERVGIGGHFLSQPETRDFTRRQTVEIPENRLLLFGNEPEARHGDEKRTCPPDRRRRIFNVAFKTRRPSRQTGSAVDQVLVQSMQVSTISASLSGWSL